MLYLHGIGHFHPENIITNRFLEELEIGTDEAWILERVGIRERRTVLPLDYIRQTKNRDPRAAHEASLYRDAQTAAAAARMALDRAGLKPSDIGLVIAGSSSPGLFDSRGGGHGGGGAGHRRNLFRCKLGLHDLRNAG
jgi:3-oxoacyl-[acyl-carrier-protein] synthase-3